MTSENFIEWSRSLRKDGCTHSPELIDMHEKALAQILKNQEDMMTINIVNGEGDGIARPHTLQDALQTLYNRTDSKKKLARLSKDVSLLNPIVRFIAFVVFLLAWFFGSSLMSDSKNKSFKEELKKELKQEIFNSVK